MKLKRAFKLKKDKIHKKLNDYLKKYVEDKLKELGGTIVDSGTFTDNSGSDILFKINDKQYYIEMTEENDIKELIDKEFIQ